MKLWSSFVKELIIASRGFYFYVEIGMALVLLFTLLFVIPENFSAKQDEYLYLDFPSSTVEEQFVDNFGDLDGPPEAVNLKVGDDVFAARLYETEDRRIYILESEDALARLAKDRHKIGAAVTMDAQSYELQYTYYLQGNETERLKGLLRILHGPDDPALFEAAENQEIRSLTGGHVLLTDRENMLPVILTFNGSLMGFFIIAAYIFLDKKEGVIKAYAVTPSPVWQYLLSKVMVLTATMLATSLLLIVPIMGLRINYLMLIAFLIPTGLFASGMGLVLAGYYDDMVKSFGVMYLLMLGMMLPAMAYFTPGWDPLWLKFIPSYYIVFGFREIFIKGDAGFVLLISLGFLVVAAGLFAWATSRFKRTLSV